MTKRVAICGTWRRSSLVEPEGWELWGLGQDPMAAYFDRVFEVHPRAKWLQKNPERLARLKARTGPVYMQQRYPEIPASVAIPRAAMLADRALSGDGFQCTAAWMLGLAIHEAVDAIGVHGIDMGHFGPYAHQRANFQYLLGVAGGRGIALSFGETAAKLLSPDALYGPIEDDPWP